MPGLARKRRQAARMRKARKASPIGRPMRTATRIVTAPIRAGMGMISDVAQGTKQLFTPKG